MASVCMPVCLLATNLDSLKHELNNSKEVGDKVMCLLALSTAYERESADSALHFATEAYQLNKQLQEDSLKAMTTAFMIQTSYNKHRNHADEERLKTWLQECEQYQVKTALAIAYNKFGEFVYRTGRMNVGLEFYHKALKLKEEINASDLELASVHNNIAGVLKHMKQYEEAIKAYNKSIALFVSSGNEDFLYKVYLSLSTMYGSDNKNKLGIYNADSSIHYAQKALSIAQKTEFPRAILYSKAMLIYAIAFQDTISEEQARLGMQFVPEVKKAFEGNPSSLQYVSTLLNEGHLKLALGKTNEALALLTEAKRLNDPKYKFVRDPIRLERAVYLKLGDYEKAYRALVALKKDDDTFHYDYKRWQLDEMRAKYETEKKDAEIKELAQQKAISDLEAKQKNQWLVFGGITFLAIIGGIFFWSRQKSIKERAEKAEIEQRFLRSQLNPHFIFNALDSIQSFVIANDPIQASNYMSSFAKLMRQVLENSREKFISLDEEISMLENYMELQMLQTSHDFSYEVQVDDHIDPEFTSIPPMFVQPFVENAIEHGVIQGNGKITVNFTKENDLINISVLDNGVGLSASLGKAKTSSHNSLASSIIKERIDQYNEKLKTNIEVLISEITGEGNSVLGTKVELKVPFQLT